MSKSRIYLVTDEVDKVATLVRAKSQASAVHHMVKGRYSAAAANPETVLQWVEANPGAKVETAGDE